MATLATLATVGIGFEDVHERKTAVVRGWLRGKIQAEARSLTAHHCVPSMRSGLHAMAVMRATGGTGVGEAVEAVEGVCKEQEGMVDCVVVSLGYAVRRAIQGKMYF